MHPNGRVALVTGAARGIGFQIARFLQKEGARVVITDIDKESLNSAKKELSGFEGQGSITGAYPNDVSDEDDVRETVELIRRNHGQIDILVNNAGIPLHKNLRDVSLDEWRTVFDVNFFGPLNYIDAVLPAMLDRSDGHIVNISSGQAFFQIPTWGAYAISKLALGALTNSLYYELHPEGIDVTGVYPFVVQTDFYSDVGLDSFGSWLSMKLMPYYAHTPESMGRTVVEAIKKNKKTEMTSVFNAMAYAANHLPGVSRVLNHAMSRLMREDES